MKFVYEPELIEYMKEKGHKNIVVELVQINNSEIEIEYYNLHGMKVSAKQLSPGIYICRQGSKITKILIK